MNIKQTIISLALLLGVGVAFMPVQTVKAQEKCGEVDTAIISCSNVNDESGNVEQSGVWALLEMVIMIMTAGVGILAVGGIVYGAILYTSAGGSPEQVKKAVGIILNVVIGLLAFALMFVVSNFLIPGGIFSTGESSSSSVPTEDKGNPGTGGPMRVE